MISINEESGFSRVMYVLVWFIFVFFSFFLKTEISLNFKKTSKKRTVCYIVMK